MTFLQAANLLIGLLLYPYLIRVLGKEAYGTYIFIASNIQFFTIIISFGFTYPALKNISLSPNDNKIKSQTVSEVFSAKICLLGFCVPVLALCIYAIPFVRTNALVYIVVFATLLIDVLFPTWYFQGIQKMKFVTYVNVISRILTIPLIFIFIQSPSDLLKYVLIVSVFPILGGLFTFFYMQIKERIEIRFVSLTKLKVLFADSLPFFWTSAFNMLKRESVTFIIGTFFNMDNVAFYDLANKIVSIPRLVTNSINSALFPKVIKAYSSENVKRIIKYETIIGLSITFLVALFGYWAVLLLGGRDMLTAYPLAVILSFTIYTWLIVGCYIDFVFVPHHKYYFVTKNQFAALISFLLLAAIGLLLAKNIIVLVAGYTLSHVVEIIYCKYLIRKHRLL
jgi:PST family polysaccharide transporter